MTSAVFAFDSVGGGDSRELKMASSSHSSEETCDLDEERSGRSVIVSKIPQGVTENELTIHFQRRRNGGGEVESVSMMKQSAVITFEDPKGTSTSSLVFSPILSYV